MGCFLTRLDVEKTVTNKVYQFRRRVPNREPSINEVAIMISDVPQKDRSEVSLKIIEAFQHT